MFHPTSSSKPRPATKTRRHDLDWLRVLAFALLIFFHAAIAFVPGGIPMIQNATTSNVLEVAVAFFHQFRLALLFLVSGVGVAFAMRSRDRKAFIRERSRRLLIPLVFGILVVVPPMVYLEKLFIGAFDCTFASFYVSLFTQGTYPAGNLSWHHYWFIAYLYLFCLLGLPLFLYLRAAPKRVAAINSWLSKGRRPLAFIGVLAIPEIALRAAFPGFRDLIHDWASFVHWFLIFVAGFWLANHRRLLDRTQALRRVALLGAVSATSLLFALFWSAEHGFFHPGAPYSTTFSAYIVFCVLRVANVWLWLVAIVGYAGVYLQRPGRALNYLNEAIYPLFCLHLTLIVALGYVVVPLQLGLWSKYLLISAGTLAVSLGLHHFLIRPSRWLRPVMGLKPLPPRPSALPYGIAPPAAPTDE